jgi:putative ABC transport system permease protein
VTRASLGKTGMASSSRSNLWIFAFRNLASRPLRTILALIGLSIPVLGVVGMFSLSAGIRNLLDDTLAQIQGILVLRENAPTDLFSNLPASMAQSLRKVPGVRVVAPQIWKFAPSIEGRPSIGRTAPGQSREGPLRALLNLVQIDGLDLAEHLKLRSDVYRARMVPAASGGGRFLDLSDVGRPNIVVSTRIAGEFADEHGDPRKVGDALRIGSKSFTIVGLYETKSILLDETIVMDIASARALLSLDDKMVSCFLVEPVDLARTGDVAAEIERTVPGVNARTMVDFHVAVGRLLGNLDVLMLLILSLALVVGSVGILNTMLMSTSERLAEFGILRSCGWSRAELLALVLAESVLLGLFAGLAGCLLAVCGISIVNPFLDGGIRLRIGPGTIVLGLVLALSLGALGGLYPAWRASRLAPMEVIRCGSQ